MPQDPTGSGSSSSSSTSDFAESDDRNDDDDDDDDDDDAAAVAAENTDEENHQLARISAGCTLDHLARCDEDIYESVANEGRPLEYLPSSREAPYDSRSVSKVGDYNRRYDHRFPITREYTETALTGPVNGLQDYNSSSANSLDDLCRGHQRVPGDFNRDGETTSTRDHYMVPTRDPRELNERILSLFNPQFLPNFNDMIMYVANQYDTRRSPPPRSRSMVDGEDRLFRSTSYRTKRLDASSMFFRRGLTYEQTPK